MPNSRVVVSLRTRWAHCKKWIIPCLRELNLFLGVFVFLEKLCQGRWKPHLLHFFPTIHMCENCWSGRLVWTSRPTVMMKDNGPRLKPINSWQCGAFTQGAERPPCHTSDRLLDEAAAGPLLLSTGRWCFRELIHFHPSLSGREFNWKHITCHGKVFSRAVTHRRRGQTGSGVFRVYTVDMYTVLIDPGCFLSAW